MNTAMKMPIKDTINQKMLNSLEGCLLAIDHVAIAVTNLDESVAWYIQTFGFRLLEKRNTRGKHTGMLSAVLTCGGTVIVLVQGTEPESAISRFIDNFGMGVQHIAFSVSDMTIAMKRVVEAGGAADTPLIEDKGIKQVFLKRDPGSGVRIELIERKGGDFSDQSVQQLFDAFEERELV